jgi:hypothetical protein
MKMQRPSDAIGMDLTQPGIMMVVNLAIVPALVSHMPAVIFK